MVSAVAAAESAAAAATADNAVASRVAWKGSVVNEMEVHQLIRNCKMPRDTQCRVLGLEIVPEPQAGKRVVFVAHFERGFGLPVSTFLREFLDFHQLQPHHLA